VPFLRGKSVLEDFARLSGIGRWLVPPVTSRRTSASGWSFQEAALTEIEIFIESFGQHLFFVGLVLE
jgi:hypothetical protein